MYARPRTPKIPLSPSSPPETGLKGRRTSETFAKLPPSPPHMSVATKSYVSYGHTSHVDEAASRSSPRSPTSSYTRTSTQRNSQPYSTPTSSQSGQPGVNMNEDSDQHRDKRQRREEDIKDEMELDQSILPTNHDRLKKEDDVKLPVGDYLEAQDTRGNEALEQLEKDMGDPFLLCRSRVPPAKPDPQNHMLSIYGLGPLLRTVARLDPNTGEKINKLRKSYEGQIKGFQLSGRNKPVKHESSKGPSFRESIGSGRWPAPLESDEDWNRNHATRKIEVDGDFKAKLRQAMQMQPGKVRDEQKWDDVLGHEKTRPIPSVASANLPPTNAQRPNGHLRPPPSTVDARRTTRGKKRSYGDDSFVGYGDGYSDVEDQNDPDGEDGSDDGSRKKRRKRSIDRSVVPASASKAQAQRYGTTITAGDDVEERTRLAKVISRWRS